MHLVVSYVPLLRGEAGATIALERARETLGPMLETDAGHVEAVVWAADNEGNPWPILVLDRADEVFEHLVEWAEGSPSAWFKLAWGDINPADRGCNEQSLTDGSRLLSVECCGS